MDPLRDSARSTKTGLSLLRDERAVTALEYCVIGSFLSLIIVSVFTQVFKAMLPFMATIISTLSK